MVDQQPTRVIMVLENATGEQITWTDPAPRWLSAALLADFAAGIPWEGKRVKRAMIVDQAL